MNAQKAEAAVWDAVTVVPTDPENLKSDLEAMIEREKKTRSDPEREARGWGRDTCRGRAQAREVPGDVHRRCHDAGRVEI
jgi:hypothetical protein